MHADDVVNLLVVDDIQYNLDAMEALLSQPGIRILQARSGEEALELLLTHEVALALLDVNMPGMNGFALAELMRGNSRTRHIPLIFVTAALHEPGRTFAGYQSGAVDFLNKPFPPEILLSKVRIFIEMYRQKKLLGQKIAELQDALHINELFVAVLGHDLRTPLAAAIHGAELVEVLSTDEKITAAAQRIKACGMRMESMVNRLLDTALIRSGRLEIMSAPGNYRDVAAAVIEEFKGSHHGTAIGLSDQGDMAGEFDPDRMAQVLSNLIGNAIKHGIAHAPVTVRIDGMRHDRICLEVCNAGEISPDRVEDVFQPFQSGRQNRTASAGLGLGLYIVKSFVEAHGGEITVRSSPEDGTTFCVDIPRRVAGSLAR
ncbi:hybrid sensor histidine kinase/response regulator [Noviherbaspirillum galbum]|uniref:histidine kinase n=1 Tax=Noviherbaspirillum galbum TaxID=2709383 RepID=A0A6B3SPC1_9BURK|nr:hybrid sensor histidine kinase/response regulator [Noviherbaspirillum galbum]NEX62597.1 response regulator [Noviherbaspirillum galbum]